MHMRLKLMGVAALVLILVTPGVSRAGFVNGNFETYTGGYNNVASQLGNSGTGGYSALTGWTVGTNTYGFLMAPGSADTTGSYSPQFGNTFSLWGSKNGGANVLPATSPVGGNYLALDDGANYRGAGISQVIDGLTAGQRYSVSFYWASGQQKGYDGETDESFQVSFAGLTQTTANEHNISHGFTNWSKQTFTFTADSTSDTLSFLAIGTPGGLPPMVLLDGVTFASVPEPASLALVGVGLGLAMVTSRIRRGKSTPA